MQDHVLEALEQGALLLTANRRLTRQWRHAYEARRLAGGEAVWAAPAVRAWPDWVSESIDALLPDRLIPTPFAELRAWRRIIGDSPLLDRQATAEGAAQAWALCQQYRVPLDHAGFADNEDTTQFRGWAREFERGVDRRLWLPAARRESWLAEQMQPLAREVWLDGFDEITPAQRALLDRLKWRRHEGEAAPAGAVTRAKFADALAEIEAAARWARTLLEDGRARNVGIVVQNLAGLRPTVEAVFEDVLGGPLFNISLGRPLTEWPVVADALRLLRWLAKPLEIGEAGVLLRSPFLRGAAEERAARAALDRRLRDENVLEVTAGYARSLGPAILAECLGRALQLAAGQAKQSPGAWARVFPELLAAAGWPGDRTQSSAERQAMARWKQLLDEFAALDMVEGALGLGAAVSLLEELAGQEIFQPETAEMPVQILEALQAAGSRFDAMWAMGLTDTAWPGPARPNPFLPRALQRELDLPHATPERELRFAREITDRLLRSAATVVLSHPERDGEEELRPSRLILPYAEATPETRVFGGYEIGAALEEGWDRTAPPLPAEGKIRGGTGALSDQSVCPFRAFARVRLRAEEWPEPEPGLSALERGVVLHGALAVLWKRFGSRAALGASTAAEREAAFADAVETGCKDLPTAGREELVRLEKIRLRAVLEAWLELDFERGDFTVEHVEHDFDLTAAGPPMRARADRIDRLATGETVVIDYKSSAPGKRVWEGERPDNLQLPLYAVALPETPGAIVFAQLKRGEHKFDGYGSAKEMLPGVKVPEAGWDAQLDEWRGTVTKIWNEFKDGRADVDPKDGGKPCANCHLHSLCRVYDTGLPPQEE